jgi:hypothetical protein
MRENDIEVRGGGQKGVRAIVAEIGQPTGKKAAREQNKRRRSILI